MPPLPSINTNIIRFRMSANTVRVWRDGWLGDMFEVFTQEEWDAGRRTLERLSFSVLEADDND